MLTIVTFLWGDKYGIDDVLKLHGGLSRHLHQKHRLLCVTEASRDIKLPRGVEVSAIRDPELLQYRGCFARLRMFDPQWQSDHGVMADADALISIDLDVVITSALDLVFKRSEPFVILQGANALNPCPYNGSLWRLRRGAHPEVWSQFSMRRAIATPFFEFPDDQGWLWHMIPNAAGWKAGRKSGVYAFQKPGWSTINDDLPGDARMVVFPGWRSPSKFRHLQWVREHWRA